MKSKLCPIHISASGTGKYESLHMFYKQYEETIGDIYICSQKDYAKQDNFTYLPLYFLSLL